MHNNFNKSWIYFSWNIRHFHVPDYYISMSFNKISSTSFCLIINMHAYCAYFLHAFLTKCFQRRHFFKSLLVSVSIVHIYTGLVKLNSQWFIFQMNFQMNWETVKKRSYCVAYMEHEPNGLHSFHVMKTIENVFRQFI